MTFTTPYVNISGMPSAIPTRLEYTNAKVASAYYNAIMAFVRVLQLQGSATSSNAYPASLISALNVSEVNAALNQLTNLAKYGVIVTSSGQIIYPSSIVSAGFLAAHGLSAKVPPSAGKSSYNQHLMTMSMAQDYDAILRSLAAIGVNTNAAGSNIPQLSANQLKQWLDLAIQVSAVANAVQAAQLEGYGGARGLQSIIEIDYVQTGNQIISKNMAQLKSALNTTQQILDNLAELQNLHNQITTKSSAFNFNYGDGRGKDGPSAWSPGYQQAASAFYNKPITPVILPSIAPGSSGFVSAYKKLVNIRTQLTEQLKTLSAITSASDRSNTTSLYSRLTQVLTDLNTTFSVNGQPVLSTTPPGLASAGFRKWMLDNYSAFNSSDANAAGKFQQNITFAITASENLNDTQKETVRNYLYIFEEYYKSASAALQAISQIIQKMAQNIAR